MNRMNRLVTVVASLAVLFGAVGLGYWWGRSHAETPASNTSGADIGERKILYWYDPMLPQERYDKPGKSSMGMTLIPKYADAAAGSGERKVLYWFDPMVPDQHFDKPGKSPFMDMQLVPKYADEAAEGGITIAPGVRQNLGMRTVTVKRGSLAGAVRVPGTISWDLRQERVVSARVDAIIDRLYIKAPYEPVRAGQPLASVLAPAWSTALAEARALGQARSASARALQSASRERLRVLGLPAGAGGAGRGGSITLTSPVTGVVSEIGVREGQSAPMGTLLFRVNGTATVWLEAAIPQAGVAGIIAGTPVEAIVDANPGQVFSGRVQTLLPQVDTGSRTQRARIVLDNANGLLAPGMFAQVTLKPVDTAEHTLVPSDALIGSGAQARVIVLGKDDRFRPIAVQPGRSGGGMTEILSGLEGGERVVASGQFLIDSEANLTGALERLGAATSAPSTTTNDQSNDEENKDSTTRPGAPAVVPRKATPPASTSPRKASAPTTSSKPSERKVLYWYDPMVPDKHFDQPGKSPYMDMQLVPKYADDGDTQEPRP
jgi:membrane fusion protein, copper/silver efflux system